MNCLYLVSFVEHVLPQQVAQFHIIVDEKNRFHEAHHPNRILTCGLATEYPRFRNFRLPLLILLGTPDRPYLVRRRSDDFVFLRLLYGPFILLVWNSASSSPHWNCAGIQIKFDEDLIEILNAKEKHTMKFIAIAGFLCLNVVAWAQDIQFDYDRSANFGAYKTYEWVDPRGGQSVSQLMDQNIKRAVEAQLAVKGLHRVESGGDLQITYRVALDHEKEFDGWRSGPRWAGTTRVTSSTIDISKLVVDFYDPAKKQLVWRGAAAKTLDIKKDPDKNYQNLQKAMAKLFKNYPPGTGKR